MQSARGYANNLCDFMSVYGIRINLSVGKGIREYFFSAHLMIAMVSACCLHMSPHVAEFVIKMFTVDSQRDGVTVAVLESRMDRAAADTPRSFRDHIAAVILQEGSYCRRNHIAGGIILQEESYCRRDHIAGIILQESYCLKLGSCFWDHIARAVWINENPVKVKSGVIR